MKSKDISSYEINLLIENGDANLFREKINSIHQERRDYLFFYSKKIMIHDLVSKEKQEFAKIIINSVSIDKLIDLLKSKDRNGDTILHLICANLNDHLERFIRDKCIIESGNFEESHLFEILQSIKNSYGKTPQDLKIEAVEGKFKILEVKQDQNKRDDLNFAGRWSYSSQITTLPIPANSVEISSNNSPVRKNSYLSDFTKRHSWVDNLSLEEKEKKI